MAYEGFNYPAGDSLTNSSAQGSGGSFGWSGRWTGANTSFATNSALSLTYTDPLGNTLTTNGGSVIIGIPAGATANAQPSRSFNFGTLTGTTYSGLTGPGTYWVSFIMQWVGPVTAGSTTNQYVRKGDLAFRTGSTTNASSTGTAIVAVGSPNANNRFGTPIDTWATWSGNDAGAGVNNTGLAASTAPLNAPTFVLMRIDLDGSSAVDTVYTWFNWTNLNSEPVISTANVTNNSVNDDGLNNIRFDANGGNAAGTNTVLAVDEIRLGNLFSDVTPNTAILIPLPTITANPHDATATLSYTATFNVAAVGPGPLTYQWYLNTNTLLLNQTNTSLVINNVQYTDAGAYTCVVANGGGAVTSSVANLTVLVPVLPAITSEPVDLTNAIGFPATFTFGVSGTAPLIYQWYDNNVLVANQTNATLLFTIASSNDAGAFFAIATNNFGAVTSSVVHLSVSPFAPSQLPSFPGADGAGKLTSGGRGGTVYHVTVLDQNLSDDRPGTLRYGLQNVSGPKTIVFDVAGTFWLGIYGSASNYDNGWDTTSRFTISSDTTIAGQTAPGPVIIQGGQIKEGGNNVIIRNITCAAGYGMRGYQVPPALPAVGDFPDTFTFDCIDISGHSLMIDHVTTLYNTDEAVSCNELTYDCTVENCNISQGQNYPQIDPEENDTWSGHALAQLWEPAPGGKTTVENNLFAHMAGRLPALGGGGITDYRNNVVYNWFNEAGYESRNDSYNNFLGNYYLAGPGGYGEESLTSSNIIYKTGGNLVFYGQGLPVYIYPSGNIRDIDHNGIAQFYMTADDNYQASLIVTQAYDVSIGLTLSAADTYTNVLRHAGSRWWERPYDFRIGNTNAITTDDMNAYVNERLIRETVTGTGNIIAWADDPFNSDPNEGVEWRELLALRADPVTGAAPYNRPANWDTDGDGMPDYWELDHGLNPNDPSDGNGDYDGDGYSNLEKYLNEIAAWPSPVPVLFTGDKNGRYAEVFNWHVSSQSVNITNRGNVTTYSYWEPSRYDAAIISSNTVLVDAVGQHAGTLFLTNGATLNITNGWLRIANCLDVDAGSTNNLSATGQLVITNNLVNRGTLRLTGGSVLSVGGTFTNTGVLDVMTWNGTLPVNLVNLGTILDSSLIRLTSPQVQGGDFQATIQGYDGHSYQLQYRNDLLSGQWLNTGGSIVGADVPITLVHAGGVANGQRFYRVTVN